MSVDGASQPTGDITEEADARYTQLDPEIVDTVNGSVWPGIGVFRDEEGVVWILVRGTRDGCSFACIGVYSTLRRAAWRARKVAGGDSDTGVTVDNMIAHQTSRSVRLEWADQYVSAIRYQLDDFAGYARGWSG